MRTFTEERDWGQFHSPKNLAMALSIEVGEISELFQQASGNVRQTQLFLDHAHLNTTQIYLEQLAHRRGTPPLAGDGEPIRAVILMEYAHGLRRIWGEWLVRLMEEEAGRTEG